MIVECSSARKSNMRTLPSAPTLANTSTLPAMNATSKTSLSCAMSCVLACCVVISQTVHVVSIDEVTIILGLILFQSKEVKGAVTSVFGLLNTAFD